MIGEIIITIIVCSILPIIFWGMGSNAVDDYEMSKQAKKLGLTYKEYKQQLKEENRKPSYKERRKLSRERKFNLTKLMKGGKE